MKRNYQILILSILLVIVLITVILLPRKMESEFSCYTYDSQGRILKGHWSEADGVWYLFVTSTQDVAEIKLHCTGMVTRTSAGTLIQNTVTGGFQASGDQLVLTQDDGMSQIVVVLQSSLPSVYVDLKSTTLGGIHADKDKKHKYNSVYIMDPEDTWNLAVEGTAEIKGRGNSSWQEYEKKGYQLKFESKTSVLGMGEAEKWVLLANASDDSMMRTQIVSRMAENLDMDYVASFAYVDLWIEGEYLGTYLLGEKVEIGTSRLNLMNRSGALFEHDVTFYLDEEYWFLCKTLNRQFALKEIVEEKYAQIQTAVTDFEAAVDTLMQYLYMTPSEKVTLVELSQMIDVDSFIKYYLINEYTLNRESFSTSFYWYKDGQEDTIHLGPVWDFDTCMGNDGEPSTASYGDNHVMFRHLMAAPAFYERTVELLEVYRDELECMKDDVEVLRTEIAQSAKMNYLRWDVLDKPNPKGGTDFAPTFDAAVDTLKQWLEGREDGFRIARSKIASSVVNEDCSAITVCVYPEDNHDSVMVALWSEENGQDDVAWYSASKADDGTWQCFIKLGSHSDAGVYYYDVYADNQQSPMATGRNYVKTAPIPQYDLTPEIIDDSAELVIRLKDNSGDLTLVQFDVWNATACNTSFHRLQAKKNWQGVWTAKVPVCGFDLAESDTLIVYAYGTEQAAERKLCERQVFVEKVFSHTYSGDACTACGDISGIKEFRAKIPIYCLRDPNTGEYFYTAVSAERDYLIASQWQDEGIGWYAPIFGGEPVYRLVQPQTGSHYFAKDSDEAALMEGNGWKMEGNCWNSHAGGEPIYRMCKQGSYLYTASEEERDSLVALGWEYEGIAWYGAPST